MSLVYLQQGNVKKFKKLIKLANIDEENFRNNLRNFNEGFTLSLENTVLGVGQIDPLPSLLSVKKIFLKMFLSLY